MKHMPNIIIFLILSVTVPPCHAQTTLNLDRIQLIESANCNYKIGWSEEAVGCYQLTQAVVDDYNQFHKDANLTLQDVMEDEMNHHIAYWYLTIRIPQMLRYYNKPVTVDNILISYNAGISYVVHNKELPEITKQYLIKYHK